MPAGMMDENRLRAQMQQPLIKQLRGVFYLSHPGISGPFFLFSQGKIYFFRNFCRLCSKKVIGETVIP